MLTVKSTINVSGQSVPNIIPVVQGDTGRSIVFSLADFTIPTGSTARYYVQKPSGNAVYNNATIEDNSVIVSLTAQAIAETGDNYGQVRIEKDGEIVTSFDFILLVKAFRGIGAVESKTEMNIFDKAVEQAEAEITEAKEAAIEEIGEAGLENIADEFNSANSYLTGEYVLYNGKLYKFTSAHSGAWTGSDAEELTVGDALADLEDETTQLKADLNENLNKIFDDVYNVNEGRTVTWQQGGLSQNGDPVTATNRIRTTFVQTHKPYKVDVPPGYKIRIGYYTSDSSGANFAFWDEWKTGKIYIYANYDYDWRALLKKDDDADIDTTVGKNILFYPIDPQNFTTQSYVDDRVYKDESVKIVNSNQHYWNIEAEKAILTEINAQFYASNPIPVEEGQVYTLTARQGATDKARIWVITDDNYNIVAMCDNFNGTELHTVTFTVPSGGRLLLLTKQQTGSLQTLTQKTTALDILTQPLKGKKLSLLGDSISALAGTIPDGNTPYYSGSNYGITSPSQMWWSVLCSETGMTPCVINGWSGSGINWQTDSNHANITPMSDDTRCGGLHNETETPDIILIAGGVNDYTYAEYVQNEPLEWDGITPPTYTEPSTGKQIYTSFTEAYVAMIKKIQTNYPKAIVVALSTWFTMRGTDNGYVLTHTVGNNTYTQSDYNDKIRFVAEQMHIPYIDVSNIGFNRNNFYPTYASDSATIPTHPNASGHAVMGKAIAEKLIQLVKGFV